MFRPDSTRDERGRGEEIHQLEYLIFAEIKTQAPRWKETAIVQWGLYKKQELHFQRKSSTEAKQEAKEEFSIGGGEEQVG